MRIGNKDDRTLRCVLAAGVAVLALSGCVSGTTYGTGVSQEEQTLQDMYSMFSLKSKKKNIDYSPRPDLVVPQNKQALVEPLDQVASTSNPDWPETPEARIARIRAQAGEVDPRTGEVGVEESLRQKDGIGIETGERFKKFIPGVTDKDGNVINVKGEEGQAARAEVLKAKADLSISPGANRKYLTEPPVKYRQPAESAPAGIDAYNEAEKAAKAEEIRLAKAKAIKELGNKN